MKMSSEKNLRDMTGATDIAAARRAIVSRAMVKARDKLQAMFREQEPVINAEDVS